MNKILLIGITVGIASLTQATAINYTFQENDSPANTTTKLGTSATFAESGHTITAFGYFGSNPMFSGPVGSMTLNDYGTSYLAAKYTTGSPAETGLGIWYNSDKEIDNFHAVILDLTSIDSLLSGATLGLGSLQSGENAKLYGSTDGSKWTYLATIAQTGGAAMNSYALDGTYDWIGVTETGSGGDKNVLITGLSVPTGLIVGAPDGGSTATLLGLALAGFSLLRRKFAPAKKAA